MNNNYLKVEPSDVDPLEKFRKFLDELDDNDYKELLPRRYKAGCLHDNCPECHGSGFGRRGVCIHMISCPCPSCSPTMCMRENKYEQNITAGIA